MKLKLTISSSVPSAKLEEVKTYFEKTTQFKTVYCKAKQSIATFSLRKDQKTGFKTTIRKQKAIDFLKKIKDLILTKEDTFNKKYSSNTFTIGFKDFNNLKLVPYNYKAPEFGLAIALSFEPPGLRVFKKKYNVCNKKQKLVVNSKIAYDFLKNKLNETS